MQAHEVRCLVVDALDDVNLAVVGPVGAEGPAGEGVSVFSAS